MSGCKLQENYAVQYGFSNEVITETKFVITKDGVDMEIPFSDFSCDPKSFKAVLERRGNEFTMIIQGTETQQRCNQKFSAEIRGISSGDYTIKVIYKKSGEEQEVLYRDFSI
ncbi:hypothetical protein HYZ76_02690 [Candidatus Falkowbacteria bacterium]|nr:hypothetical protein [Candidatus Falkowbacteria bacterium]